MNKEDLIDLLNDIAESDLVEGADIHDHPCTVAVRALNQCFEDIDCLRQVINNPSRPSIDNPSRGRSKRVQVLVGMSYSPTW